MKLSDLDPNYQGTQDEIEIPDEIVETLHDFRRSEASQGRTRRRYKASRTLPINLIANSAHYASRPDCEEKLTALYAHEELLLAIQSLSTTQARRIHAVFFQGMSCAEVAKMDQVSRAAVTKTIKKALKKLFLKKFSKRG